MHSVTDRQTDGGTDGRHDDANIRIIIIMNVIVPYLQQLGR